MSGFPLWSGVSGNTFGDFPAEHWGHVRTTNSIENTLSTLRLRDRRMKGSWSRRASLTMMVRLAQSASRRWRSVASGGWSRDSAGGGSD